MFLAWFLQLDAVLNEEGDQKMLQKENIMKRNMRDHSEYLVHCKAIGKCLENGFKSYRVKMIQDVVERK